MSNAEALQLVKDYTEGKACQQVEFYIVSTQSVDDFADVLQLLAHKVLNVDP